MSVNCKRCGKDLTSEESKKRGYGPTCYKIVTYQNKKKWKLKVRKALNTLKYRKKREVMIQQIQVPEVVSVNNPFMQDVLDRVRKLELDNNYLKYQVKNKAVVIGKSDDVIERIKKEAGEKIVDPALEGYRNAFRECVSELKQVLKLRKEKIESGEIDISQLSLVRK